VYYAEHTNPNKAESTKLLINLNFKVMKKLLFISHVIIVNVTLFLSFMCTFNPGGYKLSDIPKIGFENYFHPEVDINLITIGSFIGFILFNIVLILKHKK
jgi:hypothetical protein